MHDAESAGRVGSLDPHGSNPSELEGVRRVEGAELRRADAEPLGMAAGSAEHRARQGHRYLHAKQGIDVIALESGDFVRVIYIDPAWQWCSPPFFASAADLIPRPMAYYHGEIPK